MRLGGLVLFLLFLVPAAAGFLLLPFCILFGNPGRFKEALRAVDQFCNAFWLNGSGRESCSSHSWRERSAPWARFIIWLTDKFQAGHCQEANKHEQPVADFINSQP